MLFRQEALRFRQNKWSGRALLLSGVRTRYVIIFAISFFMLFFCLLILGSYTRRINVSGEIISSPRAINVLSTQQGFIINQLVNPGDRVKKGQPLYQIDVSRTTTSGIISKRRHENIEQQIITLNHIAERIAENKKVTLKMLHQQKARYEEALQHSSVVLQEAKEGLKVMRKNMDNYRTYQIKGLITKDQFINQTAIYYQQQNNLLNLRSQNEQNALQIVALQSDIQTQSVEFDNQLYQIEMQKINLMEQLNDADAESEIIITAPVQGKVDTLSVTPGQMVSNGDSLLQLIPGDFHQYELVIWVPDTAAPYLSPGKKINIRYDAFPSEKFGQFSGEITSVASSPASLQEMLTYPGSPSRIPGNPQTWYKVLVKPRSSRFYYQDRWVDAENGMKATATLFLEERKLYQWVLAPLYDIRDSAGGLVNGK